MWSPSETARRAVLWNARLAISSGMRRVVKDMPRATERRLPEEKLKALRTSLPTAFDLIGDALSGYWVSAEQGSAALLAASRAECTSSGPRVQCNTLDARLPHRGVRFL